MKGAHALASALLFGSALLVSVLRVAGAAPRPETPAEATGVRAWEEPVSVPTYAVGPAEPSPMFYAGRQYQGARGPVYPYALLDQLSDRAEPRTYRSLRLENAYVRISVLPELGGRIFSAEDRTTGYPFLYGQHVVKPALIGMAGAWISGGVEWNVLHHHRATTFMPVQSAIAEEPDGARTVWVGETEWRHRMRWVVGLTLRPGSSALEVTVRMVNRTGLPHSVLYFANAAVHASEDYEVLFPPDTAWATFHAKVAFTPWPLARGPFMGIPYAPGTDLGWWRNHPKPVSFFVYRSHLDFLGGYDHRRHEGVAIVADHETAPGKKFWTWGDGPDGRMWDRILTDEDGPYIELMSGGYSDNQPDYSWIAPGEVKAVRQVLYPIRELDGLTGATERGAFHVETREGRIRLAVHTPSRHPGARVRLSAGERILIDTTATLGPDEPFVRETPALPGIGEGDLLLEVVSAQGDVVLSGRPPRRPQTPEPSPYVPPPDPEKVGTVEELVLAGRRLEQFHSPAREPEPYYREALRRDPGHSGALTALGSLALRRGLYDEAERHLSRAVARVTADHTRARDGEPQYLLGLALVALDRTEDARDAFAAAAWDAAWTAPALLEEARLESRLGRRDRALALLRRVREASPQSTAALALEAALLRRDGHVDEAFARATDALAVDPLDPFAARERRLARVAGADAAPSPIDGLEDAADAALREDAYALETAHEYARAGLLEDAAEVLEARRPDADAKGDPMVVYTLGWLEERRGETDEAARWRRRARALPADYVFPFRLESVAVLESAIAADPGDPRAPYYLGNLLYDRQPERAIREWERARTLDPSFARVHRNLAFAYARALDDLKRAVASQETAVSLEKGEPRLYYELDRYLAWTHAPLERRLALLEESPETVARRDITRARLARVQLLLDHPDAALETLSEGRYHVWEGERGIHEAYVEARLRRGRRSLAKGDAAAALQEFRAALPIPPNIEVGQAVGAHLPAVHHHVGLALEAMGRVGEARRAFEASAGADTLLPEAHYWVGRSLEMLGRASEARVHFERLAAVRPVPVDSDRPFEVRMASREAEGAAHYRRALGLLGLGRETEARAALARALVADPDNLGADALRRTLGPARRAPARRRPARPPVEAPPRPPAEAPPETGR